MAFFVNVYFYKMSNILVLIVLNNRYWALIFIKSIKFSSENKFWLNCVITFLFSCWTRIQWFVFSFEGDFRAFVRNWPFWPPEASNSPDFIPQPRDLIQESKSHLLTLHSYIQPFLSCTWHFQRPIHSLFHS